MKSGFVCLFLTAVLATAGVEDRVQHGYADSNGVKIHYATMGKGPLVLMIHGFPDYWYSWRSQMEALSDRYQVVAIDQRGYNLSDKPKGVENYDVSLLVGDAVAVIKHLGRDKAIVVGHDWGGMVAWSLAAMRPDMVERLVIVNLPNPNGLRRELANNPAQQANSQYARNFQQPDSHTKLSAEGLAKMVAPEAERAKYVEAFQRSDFEAMMNYYRRNYPREPYTNDGPAFPKVKMPVLMFHGLKDRALLSGALNNTWDWLESDLTLVTIPSASHWAHWDAAPLVNRTMRNWLDVTSAPTTTVQTTSVEARPKGLSVSTWVREDLFAGFMVNDMERYQRGEAKLKAILDAEPDSSHGLAWLAATELFRAVLAHEAGNPEEFQRRYTRANELFTKAQTLSPNNDSMQAVFAVRGGMYTVVSDRLPENLRLEGWRKVKENYTALRQAQSRFFSRYPVHLRGEIMSGLAQASQRLGEEEEARTRLNEIITSLANTPYAARAKRWQEAPETAAKTSITCQTCHDEGRLEPSLARLKKN